MSHNPAIKCHCGHTITRKDILQKGHFLRVFGPGFIYLKYRCSHCKRLGECFVAREDWRDETRSHPTEELTWEERERLDSLGAISIDEAEEFHQELSRITLKDLIPERD